MTVLDEAHAAMIAAGEDDRARLRFLERLADAELFLLLEAEATGDTLRPRVFDLEDGATVLAFDTEDRLAGVAGTADYAALTGRALAALLTGKGIGLGLNLGVAPSEYLLSAAGVDWLAATLDRAPEDLDARPRELFAPAALPDTLLTALDAKLAGLAGLAPWAGLAGVVYADGRRGHLLAFVDPFPGAEEALARAAREALVFSGLDAGVLDVTCIASRDPVAARLEKVALRFDLPRVEPAAGPPGAAPGTDPDRPPRLK